MSEGKYAFRWELLGDIRLGRPNLGETTSIMMYRLMQFTFRDVIEQHVGTAETEKIFYEAGYLAGQAFYSNALEPTDSLNDFIKQLQSTLRELGVGILRIEKADMELGELILTISEDLDCSGLPEMDFEICTYDEGFVAALLEGFTGKPFKVKEIDCWCTGDRTCRFRANVEPSL